MKASYDKGKIIEHYEAPTIADGCAVKIPGNLTFEVVKELVDDIVTVSEKRAGSSDERLITTRESCCRRCRRISYRCSTCRKVDTYIKEKKVVAVISGGNVDLQRISSVCEQFLWRMK